jgi:hypothetical protein
MFGRLDCFEMAHRESNENQKSGKRLLPASVFLLLTIGGCNGHGDVLAEAPPPANVV